MKESGWPRLVAIGPKLELTGWSAAQCLLGTGISLLGVLALDDGRSRIERAERLATLAPEIVLITGSPEGGESSWLAEMLDLLLGQGQLAASVVIYASDSRAAPFAASLLGERLLLLPNPYPGPGREQFAPVRAALADLAGAPELAARGRRAAACLGPESQLLVELAADSVCLASTQAETTRQSVSPFTFGQGLLALERLDFDCFNSWLAEPLTRRDWLDHLGNLFLVPTTPRTAADLPLWQAVAKWLLRQALTDHLTLYPEQLTRPVQRQLRWWERLAPKTFPPVQPERVVASGEWFHVLGESDACAARLLLDGLQPEGVTELYRLPLFGDQSAGDCPASGEASLLTTAISPVGLPPRGRFCITLESQTGRKQRLYVHAGEQQTLAWTKGLSLRLSIQPRGEVDGGAGPGCVVERAVNGGALGLWIDCRGRRPLPWPVPPLHRQQLPRRGAAQKGGSGR